MPLLFVYGTLKRGFSNASELAGAAFARKAATATGYGLFSVSGYPALARRGDGVVHGELYVVSDAQLARLDVFEEVPHRYRRESIVLDDGSHAEAYVVPADRVDGFTRISSGEFSE
jgi:gamma-glutamylcyclotransferase (GGCT)/AIG2-like uncharacterized protein YtfP